MPKNTRRDSLIADRDRLLRDLNSTQQELGDPQLSLHQWNKIETEEDLPDDDTEVLAYRNGTGLLDLAHHEADHWVGSDGHTIYGITHWMETIPPATAN